MGNAAQTPSTGQNPTKPAQAAARKGDTLGDTVEYRIFMLLSHYMYMTN